MLHFKPIIGSVNPGNDLLAIIQGADAEFVYTNDNDDLLANVAISLTRDYKLHQDMGEDSRALLLKEFSMVSAATNILNSVKW